jgi:hypothetical protein
MCKIILLFIFCIPVGGPTFQVEGLGSNLSVYHHPTPSPHTHFLFLTGAISNFVCHGLNNIV